MDNVVSENFPRGGKRIVCSSTNVKRKREDALFISENPMKAKKMRKRKSSKEKASSENSWQFFFKFNGTLSYNKMQEGMIILGCVRHISNLALQIEFPGITFGLITINRISDPFTTMLTQKLHNKEGEESCVALKSMFQIGKLIPAKILTIENKSKGYEVQASTNPVDVYTDKTHSSFKKGLLIWACVLSELDHGYELSVGVKNCRVFLPYKNIDNSRKLAIGQLLYCVVHKAENTSIATTLTVSAKHEHIDKVQLMDNLNLDEIISGTKVEFIVEEIQPHGIKGHFSENCIAYLDETQIFSKVSLEKLTERSSILAYVLFVEPITKVTYLTLRNLQNLRGPQYELGKVVTSEVLTNVSRGLYLTLEKKATGFVTNKRLLNALPKDADLDITDAVRKKYPVGSRHSCRILDYSYMQEIHICTLEQKIIKEKIFSAKDLKIGQNVSVTVVKIIPNGLIVKIGHVQGFVPNLHLSNVKYTSTIKAKYSVGMCVSARVLNITAEDNVIFTLKQGLVESEKCLADIEDALPNSKYVGFVVQTKISGALIAFFGNVTGWISNRVLNSDSSERYTDPRDYFFLGQVVSVWILGFKNEKLQVSVNCPDNIKKKTIKLGQKLDGHVTAVHSNSIDVEIGKHKTEATIPKAHIGHDITLCPILLKTYEVGDEITNLMCIKNIDIPVMSRRECLAFGESQTKIPKFNDLKKDTVLRCSFEKETSSAVYVSTPIADYYENVPILNENIFSDEARPSFEKQQCILARILHVDYSAKNLILDARNNQSLTGDINDAVNLLLRNIEDIHHIIQFAQKSNWKLTQYKIGERVECKIEEIDFEGNCWVTVNNDIKGLAPKHLCRLNVQIADVVEGVVLDYNFNDDYIYICLKNDIQQKINKIQGGIIKKAKLTSCPIEILLFTKFYVLGILKDSQCNRQLVYLPLLLSENDRTKARYREGGKLKVVLQRRVADRIVGVPKKLIINLKKPVKNRIKPKTAQPEKSVTESNEQVEEDEREDFEDNDEDENETHHGIDSVHHNEDETSNMKTPDISKIHGGNAITYGESVLSGVNTFYVSESYNDSKENESSEEEELEDKEPVKKKNKLTPKERADLAKKEEERILKIEKELTDSTVTPQSAEQFDRLLLANPNSSELWLKYMAMHVAATELEKARTVAKRAIETINMTLVKEKLNIWLALLNLENMYGTKESLNEVFDEAVKFNDSLEVYLNVIKLLASSGKLNEMEEKIKKLKSKEKQNSKMWLEIGQVYYSLGKFREARNIKEAALKSILDKKRQFDLIVRFGIMEFQLGDLEQAVANFETILDTYPSKINMWIIYVDQLVKKKKIDCARKVLQRAVGQKFAVKSMKSIFQKFVSFEEQHGTIESVEDVKRKAKEYVNSTSVK